MSLFHVYVYTIHLCNLRPEDTHSIQDTPNVYAVKFYKQKPHHINIDAFCHIQHRQTSHI